ncbi:MULTISPECIES: hypothetical protein [unclassified Paracoccus (in: a-proteobacteria)]|uniref:hypothetical protein n=1 Tax=unclassified Paracoccus (in: a-proteobacteria) TaxID=2688777 RepID=UPI0012B39204|nr:MULTISPECIES: hypothetical protein [unclassified Paracoccus (in: a-proteobacteria)]UXU73678.1 hypothetical protein GB879_006925 [Paracoccus sp. SMMA_5]UXU79567.1 hypothetical protein GB880_006910 [Paracoccus sp. SMMA_5_TC]
MRRTDNGAASGQDNSPARDALIGKDGEVRELDDTFFATAKRGRPAMPAAERKVRMNLMIEPEIAAQLDKLDNKSAFVNEVLRKALG